MNANRTNVATALAALLLAGMAVFGAHLSSLATAQRSASHKTPAARNYASDPRAMQLADRIAECSGIDAAWVRRMIGSAHPSPSIRKLVLPNASAPLKKKNWSAYRARFVEPVRVRAGVAFWNAHAATLQQAERQFGVPASIIVGVLGMETLWGQQTGKIRVLDALTTLAVDFPAQHPRAALRQEYFVGELTHFLQLTHTSGSDPRALLGSYAGDMGMPQFMPSSWAQFGVDFNGDGRVDLWNADDAIGSVARYLQSHGWIAGQPVYCAAIVSVPERFAGHGLLPVLRMDELEQQGMQVDSSCAAGLASDALLAPVELEDGIDRPSVWIAATGNLRVLTRYNPSRYYAMAVTELGSAIAAAR